MGTPGYGLGLQVEMDPARPGLVGHSGAGPGSVAAAYRYNGVTVCVLGDREDLIEASSSRWKRSTLPLASSPVTPRRRDNRCNRSRTWLNKWAMPGCAPLASKRKMPPRTGSMLAPGAQPAPWAAFVPRPWNVDPPIVQRKGAATGARGAAAHEIAARGVSDAGGHLGFLDRIQASFGPHDVSDVRAHVGPGATAASERLGATAYTFGNHVAFAGTPDLHTTAHEAAHAVQQRQGVQLPDGVGVRGDVFEAHADAVASRVVRGESAADLLERGAGSGRAVAGPVVQKQDAPPMPVDDQAQADHVASAATPAASAAAPAAADHPAGEAVGNVSVSVGATMTAEAGLRAVYEQSARQITEAALKMAADGGGGPDAVEKAARWAVQARNELKVALRARGSVITKALAEARNIKKYGDKIGPSFDDLIREGKTPPDIIGSAGKANVKLSRAAARMELAGKILIAVDIAIITWEVIEAPEGTRLRTAIGGAGGLAGALAGGELGAIGGAKVGGLIGTAIEPGGGTAVGGAIGGVIGGLAGAIGGGFFGKKGAEKLFDVAQDIFAPNIAGDMQRIDTEQDALIRGGKAKR